MEKDFSWERKVLGNGVRALFLPRPSDTTARLSLAVEYGANADSDENAGMAHLLEHMLLGGSRKRIQLNKDVERLGGDINAETSFEQTIIQIDVPPERLPEASHVLAELAFDTSFEKSKLDIEHKTVLEEIDEYHDDPFEETGEMLRRCLFKIHPVRRPILGSRKSVEKFSLDEICETHQTYYAPQNMILILTGKFAREGTESVVNVFSGIKGEKVIQKARYFEKGKSNRQKSKRRKGIVQTYLRLGARTVPKTHPDSPTLDLIRVLIGSGISSRLFVELREKRGLTYDVGSLHESGSDYGYFSIDCSVKRKNQREAIRIINGELDKMRNKEVPDHELDEGKEMLRWEMLRLIDCPVMLAEMEMLFGNEDALTNYLNKTASVSAEEIVGVANRYLAESNLSFVALGP